METKKCTQCGQEKELTKENFHFKGTENRFRSWCKVCVYSFQKLRWKDRKRKAIELLGGKCYNCGYNKNMGALSFHHRDPRTKEFNWDKIRLQKWENVIKELEKCDLLCMNCHAEVHAPDLNMNFVDSGHGNANLNRNHQNVVLPTGKCPYCKNDVYGTKYCSLSCASLGHRKVIRPSKEELDNLIKSGSINAVSKEYGVSWQAVRKWVSSYEKVTT
jgi:hypothetical protein